MCELIEKLINLNNSTREKEGHRLQLQMLKILEVIFAAGQFECE